MTSRTRTESRRPARWMLATLLIMIGTLLVGACGTTSRVTDRPSDRAGAAGSIDRLTIIVPAEPGGGWDQTGRAMQRAMDSADLVGNAQVQNIGGAGGTVGLAELANEKDPDTLMVTGLVMVGAIETNKSKITLADTTPIARLTEEPLVVVVPATSPYRTIDDLIDAVRAKGKGVSITGGSAGGADHILAGMMLKDAGIDAGKLNYIPYSGGGESLAALLGNKVDAGISGVAEYSDLVRSGKVRALAVSGDTGSRELPGVRTLTEQGVDVTLTNWRGVIAPGHLDQQKAAQLTELVEKMHAAGGWQKALEVNSWEDAYLSGAEFSGYLDRETTSVQGTLHEIGLTE